MRSPTDEERAHKKSPPAMGGVQDQSQVSPEASPLDLWTIFSVWSHVLIPLCVCLLIPSFFKDTTSQTGPGPTLRTPIKLHYFLSRPCL